MKKRRTPHFGLSLVFVLLALTLFTIGSRAQTERYPGLRVRGRFLYDRFDNRVVLVGVNKMVIWTDRDGLPAFPEIAKTGANAVRIVWLTEGTAQELDIAISNALSHDLIPMVDCHDATGEWEMLSTCVDYWVQPDIVEVLKKHEHSLLINIANECGEGVVPPWEFRTAYTQAIWRMRAAGIHVPLVIDAQGYGQNIDDLQENGPYLIQADPDHNLMFSIHMWWPSEWRGSDVEQMVIDEIEESVAMELPLIVGEFAHKAVGCVCCIPYQTIIEQCHKHDIGYFPWSWGPGNQDCEEMDMTEDGTFDTLHGWGEEVALTSPHSIQNVAVRPDWLVAATPYPSPTPAPTPVPPPLPEGLLSYNRPVRVSGSETSALAGHYAVDGRWDTRWSSAWTEPQTITVDLGRVHDIARIVLAWETAYGSAYRLQASDDGETWTTLVYQQNGDGGRDDHAISATGRYVRMVGLERATEWGFSLWEFWVFDRADVELPEIPPEVEMGATPAPDDLRPDLVIANLTWSPKQPAPGEPVTFKAVVQNQGQSATRPGTQLRCGFYVDGAPVSWSAPYDKAILPQGLTTLTAQDGPDGDGVWSPGAEGGFVVTAWIDDAGPAPHNVVDERDEHNNLLAAHDLVRARPTATPGEVAEATTSTPGESAAPTEVPTPLGTPTPTEGEVTPSLLAIVLITLLLLVALAFVVLKK